MRLCCTVLHSVLSASSRNLEHRSLNEIYSFCWLTATSVVRSFMLALSVGMNFIAYKWCVTGSTQTAVVCQWWEVHSYISCFAVGSAVLSAPGIKHLWVRPRRIRGTALEGSGGEIFILFQVEGVFWGFQVVCLFVFLIL